MNIWQKITLGTKVLFGGFEAATDYLLGFLNDYLAKDGVHEKVKSVRGTVRWCADKLIEYGWLCPVKWVNDYKHVIECVAQIASSLEDGKVTTEEVKKCYTYFGSVYTEWMKED